MKVFSREFVTAAGSMTALAARVTGVAEDRLRQQEFQSDVLWLRRLCAWLMRDVAGLKSLDIAAWLGVTPAFVNEACFTARRRISARGVDLGRPDDDVARDVAALLSPYPVVTAICAPVPLADCMMAVALAFGLSRQELAGAGRSLRAARARHCFSWLAGIAAAAEPKAIARQIGRCRTAVSHGIAFVNRRPGSASLRAELLAALAGPDLPSTESLLRFGRDLETLPRSSTMERLNP